MPIAYTVHPVGYDWKKIVSIPSWHSMYTVAYWIQCLVDYKYLMLLLFFMEYDAVEHKIICRHNYVLQFLCSNVHLYTIKSFYLKLEMDLMIKRKKNVNGIYKLKIDMISLLIIPP